MHLVESEPIRTDPGMFRVVLAVMEHFTSQIFVCVVAGVLANALEFRLRQ